MTVIINRKTVRALPKINQAVILLLAEENRLEIIDDDKGENVHHPEGTSSLK
jgi:hypothetical protein